MEKEPSLEPKKLIIAKEGDIFKALTEKIEGLKKEEKCVPMDREDFVLRILADIEHHNSVITKAELAIGALQNNIQKMHNCEALGYKLDFYEKGNLYGFNLRKKGKVGFKKDE